ncbi:hypothetical protein ACNGTP_02690 [Bisgaard Taxon 45]
MNNIDEQFESLSQCFRIQLENIVKYAGLVRVSEREAISNIEVSIQSTLNAFHTIHDAIEKVSNKEIEFYSEPELKLILSVRNMKHHNKEKVKFFNDDKLFFVDFESIDDPTAKVLVYPIRWVDVIDYIENTKGREKYPLIRSFLNADEFEEKAEIQGYSLEKIYINIIPLMLVAAKKIVILCGGYITPDFKSVETKYFYKHFHTMSENQRIKCIFPYDKKEYWNTINKLIEHLQFSSDIILGPDNNPYLTEIQYKAR